MVKLGIDVDGVLADFNKSFMAKVIAVTGRDLFPARPFAVPTWNYPEHYGYTRDEVSATWEAIKSSRHFWRELPAYPETQQVLAALVDSGADVYFITARLGLEAKLQTERWLSAMMPWTKPMLPTVLITSHKGLACRTLGLDAYIDDRWENALEVSTTATESFLLARPWNAGNVLQGGIVRVASVLDFLADPRVRVFVPASRLNPAA